MRPSLFLTLSMGHPPPQIGKTAQVLQTESSKGSSTNVAEANFEKAILPSLKFPTLFSGHPKYSKHLYT